VAMTAVENRVAVDSGDNIFGIFRSLFSPNVLLKFRGSGRHFLFEEDLKKI